MQNQSRHQCLIYDGPPSHRLPALAAKIKENLDGGYRCFYLNSSAMVAGIRSNLAAMGVDVAAEVALGHLSLSSESVLAADGNFDVDSMLGQLESAVTQAVTSGYSGLFATGDISWEFGAEKNFAKLMDYERKLELLFHRHPGLKGICQYHRDTLPRDIPRLALLSHRSIFVNETLSMINPHYLAPSGVIGTELYKPSALDQTLTKICQM